MDELPKKCTSANVVPIHKKRNCDAVAANYYCCVAIVCCS